MYNYCIPVREWWRTRVHSGTRKCGKRHKQQQSSVVNKITLTQKFRFIHAIIGEYENKQDGRQYSIKCGLEIGKTYKSIDYTDSHFVFLFFHPLLYYTFEFP